MDLIREHLVYKDVPVTVCLKTLNPADHYELIRCLLATRTNNVSVCCSESSNVFVQILIKKLGVQIHPSCGTADTSADG